MKEFTLRTCIEDKIEADFDEFDFNDKPMEHYCAYNRTKHVLSAAQIVMNYIEKCGTPTVQEVDDLIHGLNHIFFNGVAAGQSFEWFKRKEH